MSHAQNRAPRCALQVQRSLDTNSEAQRACSVLITFWRETSPEGAPQESPGRKPWDKHGKNGSPEGAMQLVPVLNRCLMTSIYLELRRNVPAPPFQGFPRFGPCTQGLRPGLPCWTPSGVLGFEPETKLNKLTPGTTSLPRSIGWWSGVDGKDRFLLGGGGALSDDGAELILARLKVGHGE